MKRLSELPAEDRVIDRAQELLAAVEPLAPSHAQRERVRRALDQRRSERSAPFLRRPRALWLTALLVFAGSTLAAAQSGVLRALIVRVSGLGARHAEESPRAPRPVPTRSSKPEPPPPALPAPALAPTESAPTQMEARPPVRTHAAPTRTAYNEIVRSAVKALRRDGDAALAARLLEEAYAKSPHGALAEEVMALRVEAAEALGDARRRAYARQYLARYPAGRYQSQVERTLR